MLMTIEFRSENVSMDAIYEISLTDFSYVSSLTLVCVCTSLSIH